LLLALVGFKVGLSPNLADKLEALLCSNKVAPARWKTAA
jgi:hypothetical protein